MDTERFTFFWGDKSPFSQWYPCEFFSATNSRFNCAEQYMMLAKAKLFNDEEIAKKIMETDSPKEQKALGHKVKGFDQAKWEEYAQIVVRQGNYYKFTQNPDLWLMLKATEGTTLVEASPYDRLWGIGLAEDDPRAHNRETWLGKNWLGEVLTELRDTLIKNGM